MSINKVILVGHVGQNPEMRYTQAGDPVVNLSLATSEQWKNKNGEKQESTEWHRITFFGKPAEIVNTYVAKGSQLYVEGKIRSKKYVDNSGVERTAFEIQSESFKMLGKSNNESLKLKQQEVKHDDMNDPIPF